ncbi:MAG: four helix bundle protein, partial [Candidatus Paceibacterota bacterium]
MKQLDVPIIHKVYELYGNLHLERKSIPKSDRYTLWQKCEEVCINILEKLIQTGYLAPDKRVNFLIQTSAELDKLRIFIRLSSDIKIINQ